MNKKETIKALAELSNVKQVDVNRVLKAIHELVKTSLQNDGDILKIPHVATFRVMTSKQRKGWNLHTNKIIEIPERKQIKAKSKITFED